MHAHQRLSGRLAAMCALLVSAGPALAQWQQDAKLVPKDAAAEIEFGNAVSISGGLAALGAHLDGFGDPRAGSVYIFYQDETEWVEEAHLVASDAAPFAEFGFSVSIFANVLVVGSPFDDAAGNNSGSAYVFRRQASGWVEEAKLIPSDARSFDRAVAAGHDWVLVGAPFDDDLGNSSGSAYLFQYDGNSWTEAAKLTASSGAGGDQFGTAVALDGDVAVVGAPHGNGGAAYVFRYDGSSWTEECKLTPSDGSAGDLFGASIALRDGVAVLGAPRYDSPAGVNAGAAYLFRSESAGWVEVGVLTASDATSSDFLGGSVAVNAECAVVGANFDDDAGTNSGAAYVYRLDSDTLAEDAKLTAPDGALFDMFGSAVALDEGCVLIGAIGDDDAGDSSGSAYVFTLEQRNDPPVCDTGAGYEAGRQGGAASVMLDGTGSSDPDEDVLTYYWTTDCPDASFDDPSSATPVLSITAVSDCRTECGVTLSVSDGVNPPVSCNATVTILDTTPPAITCPAEVGLVFGESSEPSTVGFPEVEDCDPDVELAFRDAESLSNCPTDPASKTITRTWTATDSSGNSSSCEQTITVWKIALPLDIKPGECPNSHNPRSNGYLPIAILGTAEFDARHIDLASIRLGRADCVGGQVAPNAGPPGPKTTVEDVGTPIGVAQCECHGDEHDGIMDIVMKFSSSALDETLDLSSADHAVPLEVVVTGTISDPDSPFDGAAFIAVDCLRLVGRDGGKADKHGGDDEGQADKPTLPFPDPCGAGGAAVLPFTLGGLALLRKGSRGIRRVQAR
jgi:hypothetical protein